jgi:hypothetical protein
MSSFTITIPAAYRDLLDTLRGLLSNHLLSTPMNMEIRGVLQDKERLHRFDVHFPLGMHISGHLLSGVEGKHGRWVELVDVTVKVTHSPTNRSAKITVGHATLHLLNDALTKELVDMEHLIEMYGTAPAFGEKCNEQGICPEASLVDCQYCIYNESGLPPRLPAPMTIDLLGLEVEVKGWDSL